MHAGVMTREGVVGLVGNVLMKEKEYSAQVVTWGYGGSWLQDQPTSGAVLTIQFSGTLQGSVPVEMLNERNTVVLLAQPHTTARRSIEQLVRRVSWGSLIWWEGHTTHIHTHTHTHTQR